MHLTSYLFRIHVSGPQPAPHLEYSLRERLVPLLNILWITPSHLRGFYDVPYRNLFFHVRAHT
jgi:hypothetical protein